MTRPARHRLRDAIAASAVASVLMIAAASPASAALVAIAVNDSASAVSGVQLTVPAPGVLGNDLQLLGGDTADLVTDAAHGNLTLDPDGAYRYRSNGGYVGTDTFRYRILGGLLPSNTATVTITVSAPAPTPTPMPTPTPTPAPTPTPTPTPAPTPTPTPTPTPRPTSTPDTVPSILPTLSLLPTLPPLPSLLPRPSAIPSPTPEPTRTPDPSARPTDPSAATVAPPANGAGTGGGIGTSGGNNGGSGNAPSGPPLGKEGPFTVPAADRGGAIELDPGSVAFGGFEWAVPALVLSVPGLFLIIVVASQAVIGLAWLRVARRWVGEDDRAHRRRRRLRTRSAGTR
jgi:Bacterial Ig domain